MIIPLLGIEGDSGFARLGHRTEYVVIRTDAAVGTVEWSHAAELAIRTAFELLKARVPTQRIVYSRPRVPFTSSIV